MSEQYRIILMAQYISESEVLSPIDPVVVLEDKISEAAVLYYLAHNLEHDSDYSNMRDAKQFSEDISEDLVKRYKDKYFIDY